jgi:hypothetical protein
MLESLYRSIRTQRHRVVLSEAQQIADNRRQNEELPHLW